MRETVRALVEHRVFQFFVLALIIANAAILGADTLAVVKDSPLRAAIGAIDRIVIYAFVGELALRLFVYGPSYFRNGWNVFDFVIVLVSLLAATSGLSAIRAFRVLRVLRLVTIIPRMRTVVSALLGSIPGIASVGVILVIIVYVFAVIAANLYGGAHPDLFGDVFAAMYTLFQVMTLENWPDVAAAVRETHPNSWAFFVAFLMIGTFTMLNLFVAIVVRVVEEDSNPWGEQILEQNRALRAELAELRAAVDRLSERAQR